MLALLNVSCVVDRCQREDAGLNVCGFFGLTQYSYTAFIQPQFSFSFSSFLRYSHKSEQDVGKLPSYKLLIYFLEEEANGHKKSGILPRHEYL